MPKGMGFSAALIRKLYKTKTLTLRRPKLAEAPERNRETTLQRTYKSDNDIGSVGTTLAVTTTEDRNGTLA